MPEVLRAQPSAALLLVGDGEDRARLERQAAQLGIASRVRFAGAVPPEEIGPWLRASELFVRPSLSEGLGSAFLEAMACGLPVIGTRVGGIPDFLEEGRTGLFCDPQQPSTIATAILRLLEDRPLAETIGRAGRELVRTRYRWERVAEEVAALYDRLLIGNVAAGGSAGGSARGSARSGS
jgi:glycosyltransferase involved in cell wall biosynthesis